VNKKRNLVFIFLFWIPTILFSEEGDHLGEWEFTPMSIGVTEIGPDEFPASLRYLSKVEFFKDSLAHITFSDGTGKSVLYRLKAVGRGERFFFPAGELEIDPWGATRPTAGSLDVFSYKEHKLIFMTMNARGGTAKLEFYLYQRGPGYPILTGQNFRLFTSLYSSPSSSPLFGTFEFQRIDGVPVFLMELFPSEM
jgi:hypothetical protein